MNLKYIFIVFVFFFSFSLVFSVSDVTGGFNITFEFDSNPTYTSNPVSFSSINSAIPYSTDIDADSVFYEISHTTNLYNTKILITEQKGLGNTLLCEGSLANLDIQNDCLINYDNDMITDTKTYFAYVCNEYMQCSMGYPFTFKLNEDSEAITGGFKLTSQVDSNDTYTSNPVSFSTINSAKPYSTDINADNVFYELSHTANLYDTKIIITEQNGIGNSLLCEGSLANLDIQNDCLINYDNNMITDIKIYYGYVCNEYMQCSVGYPFTFVLNGDSEAITGGFKLTSQVDLNITESASSNPSNSSSLANIFPAFGYGSVIISIFVLLFGLS